MIKLNYIENRNGKRVIRWGNLAVFLAVAVVTSAITAAVVSWMLVGDLQYAVQGACGGALVVWMALCRGLTIDVERLPKAA